MRDLPAVLARDLRTFAQRVGALPRTLVLQRRLRAVGAAIVAFGFFAIVSVAPPPGSSDAQQLQEFIDEHAQTLTVDGDVDGGVTSDPAAYSVSPGIEMLARSGTNYDFARMVMLFGGWPMSDENVTVFTRWMRQENYTDSWWNRNNPLNNGWGTQGGTFMSGYVDLVDAARNAAEALNSRPAYAEIVAAFARSAPTAETERAIWFSGWATGMYNGGAHWAYDPVPEVRAPASAWGL